MNLILLKKYSALLLFVISLLGCTNSVVKSERNEVVEINYISFSVETYSPVKRLDMSKMTYKKIFLNKQEVIQIYDLLKKVSSSIVFRNKKVRLKILMPNKDIVYIEQSGIVSIGEDTRKIDKNGLKTLEKIFSIDLGLQGL